MLIVSRYSCGSMVGASTARTPFATSPLRSSKIASAFGDLEIVAPSAVASACIAAFLIPTCRAISRLKARFVTNIESPLAKASNMNAASNRGKSLTALGIAPGAQCNHHNSIHASTSASATPHPMASKSFALSDIGNSFASSPRSSRSKSQSPRSVVAATCASNSLALPTLAGADRAGV